MTDSPLAGVQVRREELPLEVRPIFDVLCEIYSVALADLQNLELPSQYTLSAARAVCARHLQEVQRIERSQAMPYRAYYSSLRPAGDLMLFLSDRHQAITVSCPTNSLFRAACLIIMPRLLSDDEVRLVDFLPIPQPPTDGMSWNGWRWVSKHF